MTDQFSGRARLVEPGEAVPYEELALAARHHALRSEALRPDVTAVGLRYLLIHFDIPDPAPPMSRTPSWSARLGGKLTPMDREHLTGWIAAYERAWRTAGTDTLATIFTAEATYRQGPYREPIIGLPAIARMWEDEREGPAEVFDMTSEVVAIEGDTAVVRVQVRYGTPVGQEYRDLWIVRFAEDGRCSSFEEWPFWPERSTTASPPGS